MLEEAKTTFRAWLALARGSDGVEFGAAGSISRSEGRFCHPARWGLKDTDVDDLNESSRRIRLLGLVKADVPAPHANRIIDPVAINSGDAEWYMENISCQWACPAMTDIARYIAHIASEDYDSAYEINLEDNVFPGLLGRVCARPCEPACRPGRIDEPIAICRLKRVAADYRKKHGPPGRIPVTKKQRVAVVGAGPA